jgi:hypothetical protein
MVHQNKISCRYPSWVRAASFDHLVGAGKTNTQIGFFGCIGNIMFFEQF